MEGDAKTALKRLLGLGREPVALRWFTKLPEDIPRLEKKDRFCGKVDQAAAGACFYATADEEECMGGAKYCGLTDAKEFAAGRRSGEFLVGMGVFKSVAAVQRAWRGFPHIEPGIFQALAFAPLSGAPFDPDVVLVLCNAKQGMELLHANAYDSGAQAVGGDAAPICSSMAAAPYLTGKVAYGFADIGSRNHMKLGADVVMVSIPGSDLARICANLGEMKTKKIFSD